ncbi:MAG: ABC-F family ATP-binding cassette domain-containing protein [Pseudomonadales bacterium]
MLLQLKNTSYTRGTKTLFRNLDLNLTAGDRIALVGHNGSGKTSLLKLLANELQADEGERIAQRGLRLAQMEQFVPAALAQVALVEAVLAILPPENRSTDAWRAEALLLSLGFHSTDFTQPLSRLSGGQQNLALFARAQLLEPELLLMDEPGNHMDVLALQQLRSYLQNTRNMSFLMISHDRELLDACCSRTLFLRDQRLYSFDLPYSAAREALKEQDAQAQHRHVVEQKEIDRIRSSAKRLAQWGKTYDNEDLARKAKTMAARADKLADEQTFVSQGSGLDLALSGDGLKSKTVFTLEELHIHTEDDERHLLSCDHLVARPGDRIALLGPNGCGKSTTIRRMMDAYSNPSDEIRFNPQTRIGYFDQELDGMASNQGRFDWLRDQVEAADKTIKQTLLHAGIAYQDFDQAVGTLSGGEKARLRFMLLALTRANLMILDEPTNHIDLESREQLEQQLIDAQATLLVTSHDRAFLQNVCNRFWLIDAQQLREIEYLDEYYQFLTDQSPTDQCLTNQVSADQVSTDQTGGSVPDAITTEPNGSENDLLKRIAELEELISADKARKAKFQKPDRQRAWQRELDALWARALEE